MMRYFNNPKDDEGIKVCPNSHRSRSPRSDAPERTMLAVGKTEKTQRLKMVENHEQPVLAGGLCTL